jgi:hypothetical protein
MKQLARSYPSWNLALQAWIGVHLSRTERPHGTGYDQHMLRELRTNQPETKDEGIGAQLGV